MNIFVFDIAHIALLGSEDRSRASNANPANEGLSWDLVVLHGIKTDQGASAAESGLAVNGHGAAVRVVLEVSLTAFDELVDDLRRRSRSISEDHVLMIDAFAEEVQAIVLGFIETHNFVYSKVLEDVDITGSSVSVTMDAVTLINWTHEGQELARNDPVEITILHLLVMLVFASIK